MNQEDKLTRSVVRVSHGGTVGSGFFIGEDGAVLTCFHVVRGQTGATVTDEPLVVTFDRVEYPASCIYPSPEPDKFDFAVLQLELGRLPPGAELLPLGPWDADAQQSRAFFSYGFRSADRFDGLFAGGAIYGQIYTGSGIRFLQLSSQAIGAEEVRAGMSGAPVYHEASGQIVGMITSRYQEGRIAGQGEAETVEVIPLALPIDALADVPAVRARLWDQALIQQLSTILHSAYFTPEAFQKFYESLPIHGLKKYADLGENKPEALLKQLRGEQIYNLINLVRARRPDIAIERQIDLPPVYRLNFVNREDERREACDRYAPQYMLFEAPAGYGKTELLKAIEQEHFRDGWLCLSVETPPDIRTALDLARRLAAQGGYNSVLAFSDLATVGRMICVVIHEKLKDQAAYLDGSKRPQVLFVIDQAEYLPQDEVGNFLNLFLPAVQEALPSLRVRVAGRYVGSAWGGQARAIQLAVRALTPFEFKYVRDTVRFRWPGLDEAALNLCAAHLMHVTGGHPGAMARLLEAQCPPHSSLQAVEDYFNSNRQRHQGQVLAIADEIRNAIPEQLRDIFDILSLFRRYNLRLLQKMIADGVVQWPGGATGLEKELTATYLVRRGKGFIQDEIVRRVLSLRMHWKEPARFGRLRQQARDMYAHDLSEVGLQAEAILVEALFQELQLGSLPEPPTPESRAALREAFFAPKGIVAGYLALLKERDDAPDSLANLQEYLENEKESWELRFTVDFLLRDLDYTDAPYQRLLEQVRGARS